MKITKYIWLIFVIVLYVINYFWLKINIWAYTGIVLGILLVLVVVINIIVKVKNRKGKTADNDFIFPTKVANTMKTIDMAVQYEASILSLFCLMIGMLLFVIYVVFLAPYNLITKIFIAFNTVCGLGLMGSMLVTNYQQFVAYKESVKMLGDLANQFGTEVISPDKMDSGNILTPLIEPEKPKEESITGKEKILDWAHREDKKEEFKPKDYMDNDYNPFLKNNEKEVR